MASRSPDPAISPLSRDLGALIGVLAGTSVLLIVAGLALTWANLGHPTTQLRLLVVGEIVMVAAPLVGVARLVFAMRENRSLALTALATLGVVGLGIVLAN